MGLNEQNSNTFLDISTHKTSCLKRLGHCQLICVSVKI